MKKLTESEYKRELKATHLAYNQVFSRENVFTQDVLSDLAKFCRAHASTFHSDPRIHAALEGRREVWLLIQNYLNLSQDELYKLHVVRKE